MTESSTPPRRKRGRPPGSKKGLPVEQKYSSTLEEYLPFDSETGTSLLSLNVQADRHEEQLAYNMSEEKMSVFSRSLRSILRHERAEISRVAKELEVADNTIYRWMNGSSMPRVVHLRRLPDVLPEHRKNLIDAINQSFPNVLDVEKEGIREVPKEIYCRVMELVAVTPDEDTRFWQVAQTIFDHSLLHLDAEQRGMSITYARLMPPHEDGVHSLRESISRGHDPWPHSMETKAFLGSTTLAGAAATLQRLQRWDALENDGRLQVEVDEFEQSACASPVLRGSKIAGVLIISSTQAGFFSDPLAVQATNEYALLLATALRESDFYAHSLIKLRPMPALKWQRAQISSCYVERVINYVRTHGMSRQQAERHVRTEMELEFEELGRISLEQRRAKIELSSNTSEA